MPTIRNNEAQQQALNEISKALSELKALSHFTQTESWNAPVNLAFGYGESAHSAIRVTIDPTDQKEDAKEVAGIIRILQQRRNRLIKDITQKANKWNIELNDTEQALLEGTVIPARRRRKKQQEEVVQDNAAVETEEVMHEENAPTEIVEAPAMTEQVYEQPVSTPEENPYSQFAQ